MGGGREKNLSQCRGPTLAGTISPNKSSLLKSTNVRAKERCWRTLSKQSSGCFSSPRSRLGVPVQDPLEPGRNS